MNKSACVFGATLFFAFGGKIAWGEVRLTNDGLEFLNSKGKVVHKINAPDSRRGPRVEKKFVSEKEQGKSEKTVQRRVFRDAMVSKSKRFVVVRENTSEFATEKIEKKGGGTEFQPVGTPLGSGILRVYDDIGDELTGFPSHKGRLFGDFRISEDDSILFVVEQCEQGCWRLSTEGEPLSKFRFFKFSGEEIFSFPNSDKECRPSSGGHWISPGGRYAIGICNPPRGLPKSIVFDIEQRKLWKAPYLIHVLKRKGKTKVQIETTSDPRQNETRDLDFEDLAWETVP